MDLLIVVAGPSCCGKSTLIHQLLAGRLPRLARDLEIDPPGAWASLLPKHVPDPPRAIAPRVLLHYDLLRRWTWRQPRADYDGDSCLGLLAAAREVTLVTLWASASTLAERLRQRRATFHRRLLRGRLWNSELLQRSGEVDSRSRSPSLWRTIIAVLRELRRLEAKRRLFRAEEPLYVIYDRWLGFCARAAPRANWIIDTGSDLEQLQPAEGWSAPPLP